jgi:hypothetical protein
MGCIIEMLTDFLGDFNEMVVEFHGMLMDFEGTF